MAKRILVLHGPNQNLLGERDGDPPGVTLATVDQTLTDAARVAGAEVRAIQSNHEGALVDALHRERRWADAVLVAPGPLAIAGHVLADALAAVGLPSVEIGPARRKSVLDCGGRVSGKGVEPYVLGLERLVADDPAGKRKPSKKAASVKQVAAGGAKTSVARGAAKASGKQTPTGAANQSVDRSNAARHSASANHGAAGGAMKSVGRSAAAKSPVVKALGRSASGDAEKTRALAEKTIGRAPAVRTEAEKSIGRARANVASPASAFLTRALVREKIAERLRGNITPSGLATWARQQYLDIERGSPAESGHRETLEDVLQQLTLSALPASRVSDADLVDLMTQLDG